MDINSNTVCRDISDFPALLKPANFQVRKDIFKFEFQDVQEAPSSTIMNPTAYCPAVETPPAHCPAAKTSPAPCPAVETAPVSCSSALLLLAEPGPYSYPLANPRPVEAPKLSTSYLTLGQVPFLWLNSTYTNPPVPAAGSTPAKTLPVPCSDVKTLPVSCHDVKAPPAHCPVIKPQSVPAAKSEAAKCAATRKLLEASYNVMTQ